MKRVTAFPCPECDQLWESERDAYTCCNGFLGRDAWECDNKWCSEFHKDEHAARFCGKLMNCVCGHREASHNVASGWAGCYELDCRCHKYEWDLR